MIASIRTALQEAANPEKAKHHAKYFKTNVGEYGEGDIFMGIAVPTLRRIAVNYKTLSLKELQELLTSPIHEERFLSLTILVLKYAKASKTEKEELVRFYLEHKSYINNWDLVDTSAPHILGAHLFQGDKSLLFDLARSPNLWDRRIAMISTQFFIKKQDFSPTLQLATLLLSDTHDLIHKAVGWMLREVGERDQSVLEDFLNSHAPMMPRTMLRYAIEKLPDSQRQYYLKIPKQSSSSSFTNPLGCS